MHLKMIQLMYFGFDNLKEFQQNYFNQWGTTGLSTKLLYILYGKVKMLKWDFL